MKGLFFDAVTAPIRNKVKSIVFHILLFYVVPTFVQNAFIGEKADRFYVEFQTSFAS